MDPVSVGAIIAGAKTGLDVIRQAAETVSAIRSASKGPEGKQVAEVDAAQLSSLAENLIEARIRTLDTLNVAEQLLVENQELRRSLGKRERFAERARSYRLRAFKDGAVSYEYVRQEGDDTPSHIICPNCFEEEKVRILQPAAVGYGETTMSCSDCSTKVAVPNSHRLSDSI